MNHLSHSVSKYLLQHVDNPVNWYPWGEEAFAIAKKENKPVLVSIGYAACHWCHVMAHESFEDADVAAFMNENFVCIKVDREEHPDVDHFYMDALQSLTGSGGWPLNMFVTPEKKPFYGGTYFPPRPMQGRNSWLGLLQSVARAWAEKPEEIARQSEQMLQHLKQASFIGIHQSVSGGLNPSSIAGICRNLLAHADKEWGGFGTAPKFPPTGALQFLLDFYQLQKQYDGVDELGKNALQHAVLTLDKMLSGGIYDRVGGGFFRYSTDAHWQIPHFEKMLYDNALMISVLATAYRVTGLEHYRDALKRTIDFCNRELKASAVPGFYCSLDADSDGGEGAYYVWSEQELNQVLINPHPAVLAYFGMNAENRSHLEIQPLCCFYSDKEITKKFGLSAEVWQDMLADSLNRLLESRQENRAAPSLDDKILLGWNALINKALQDAAIALEEDSYLLQAAEHLDWMNRVFVAADKRWYRVFKDGKAYVAAKLDDLAYLIQTEISLASLSGNNNYFFAAKELLEKIQKHFIAADGDYFYYSPDFQNDIPVRKIAVYDGAEPSPNAIMAQNLLLLGACFGNSDWLACSEKMLTGMAATAQRYARSFACWASVMQLLREKPKQLVLTGTENADIRKQWLKHYYPDVLMLSDDTGQWDIPILKNKFKTNESRFYICFQGTCLSPVSELEALTEQIKKIRE